MKGKQIAKLYTNNRIGRVSKMVCQNTCGKIDKQTKKLNKRAYEKYHFFIVKQGAYILKNIEISHNLGIQ